MVSDLIKAVFAEAKARGYDTKALRRLIVLRRRPADEVDADDAVLDLHRSVMEQE